MNPYWETERLILRPSAPELAGQVAGYYKRNKDFLRETDPVRPDAFYTEEGQRELLCQDAARQEEGRCLRLWLSRKEEPERIIGFVGLNEIVRGAFLSCFMGYHMDGTLINRGYCTEAAQKAVEIAFTQLGLHRIEANILPRNARSLRVAQKLGMEREGVSPKYLRINGVWEDHVHMVLRNRAMEQEEGEPR